MRRSNGYITAFAILVVVAVIIGVVYLAVGGGSQTDDDGQSLNAGQPTDEIETTPPATTPPAETPTPPVTTPPVINTPAPPPATTPPATQPPAPSVSASGSFMSDTGTYLNIKVDWSAESYGGDTATLNVDVSALHYSFYTSELGGSIIVKIGDREYSLSSPAVSYDGTEQRTTLMASASATVNIRESVPISVTWNYRGTYGGVELETIFASGTAYIG